MSLDAELAELAKDFIPEPAHVRLPRRPEPDPTLTLDTEAEVIAPDPRGALDFD
jgi:hypothetical protein